MAYTKKHLINLLRVLTLPLAGLLPAVAQASHFEDRCQRSDTPTLGQPIIIPVTANIGRDVQEGEAYGPWFSHTITWTCTRTAVLSGNRPYQPANDYFEARTTYYPNGQVHSAGTFAADPSFRVYRYGTIGFIAKLTQHIDGQPPQTTPINAPVGRLITTEFQAHHARREGDVSKFHLTLHTRLVKLKGPVREKGYFLAVVTNFYSKNRYDNGTTAWQHNSHYYNYLDVKNNNVQAACKLSVPTADVPLATTYTHNLAAVGKTGPGTAFNLHFKDCPAYMGSVSYQFQPWPPGVAADNGTLPQLDTSASAAQGVGVQVLDEHDQPIPFHTPVELSAYDPHQPAPDHAVPLKAHIIRTGSTLRSGTVEAAVNVMATYK